MYPAHRKQTGSIKCDCFVVVAHSNDGCGEYEWVRNTLSGCVHTGNPGPTLQRCTRHSGGKSPLWTFEWLNGGILQHRCVGLLPVVPAESVSGWMCPATDVGQMAGVQEKNRDPGRGGRDGRTIATHNNSPPERPCCCWWRKVVRAAAVSLVTESGER